MNETTMSGKNVTGISRRSFLAGAGLLATAMAGASLSGCSPSATDASSVSAEGEERSLKEADRTLETDVLVVGLGASGLLAAYGAASNGASVIAIDVSSNMAGTTNVRTSGAWCVGSALQKSAGNELTVKEAMDHINNGTNYQTNQKVLRSLLGASGRAIDALSSAGMEWRIEFDKPADEATISTRGIHWYNLTGDDRAAVFQKLADDSGVECMFSTTAEAAIIEDGKLTGIQCSQGNETVDIKARAIVMCSGGFLGNADMVAERFAGASIVVMGNPSCTGAGINMSIDAGAQIGKCFSISMNEYGGANAKASPTYAFRPDTGTNDAMRLPVFGGLLVDAEGNRFINEGFVCERCMFAAEPFVRDKYHYAVADSDFINRLATEPVSDFFGDERMKGMFEGVVCSDILSHFDTAVEEGWAYKADTIDELGDAFGLANLAQTVQEYNEYCDKGNDDLFFKDAKYLSALKTPPFYVVQSQPAGWLSLGGIKSNASCQALDADGKPIPGLFVAGADADLFTSPYYQMASANSFALSSGLIAGEAAAASL